jgi:HAD superfamily hydrolase (TIGR01456 family)
MNRALRGVCFDVDGVLWQGRNALPGAKEALDLLHARGIPLAILTNGGGVLEQRRAMDITERLGLAHPLKASQIVLSHSPIRSLADTLGDRVVLVVGEGQLDKVCLDYGFQRGIRACEFGRLFPALYPHPATLSEDRRVGRTVAELKAAGFTREDEFGAVLVLHDPVTWGRDVQLMCDVVGSSTGVVGRGPPLRGAQDQVVRLVFSNPDFLFSGAHTHPRFGQGAFKTAFTAIFKELHGFEPRVEQFGKPEVGTFRFAESLIRAQLLGEAPNSGPVKILMVGDNPAADIRGANAAGWDSALVGTGKIVDISSEKAVQGLPRGDRPTFVAKNAFEAVKRWLEI